MMYANPSPSDTTFQASILPKDALGIKDSINEEREAGLRGFGSNDVGICGIPAWPRAEDKTMGFAPAGEQATIPCHLCVKSAEKQADTSVMVRCIRDGNGKRCTNCIDLKQVCNIDYCDPNRRNTPTGNLYELLYQARKQKARSFNQYLVLPTFNSEQEAIEAEFPFEKQSRAIQQAFIACFEKPKASTIKSKEQSVAKPQPTTNVEKMQKPASVMTSSRQKSPEQPKIKEPSPDKRPSSSSLSDNTSLEPTEEMSSSTHKYRGYTLPSTISINRASVSKRSLNLDEAVKSYHQLDLTIRSALVCIGQCFDEQETLKQSWEVLRSLPRQELEHLGSSSKPVISQGDVSLESRDILATYGAAKNEDESEAGPSRKRSRYPLTQKSKLGYQGSIQSDDSDRSDLKKAGKERDKISYVYKWQKEICRFQET